MVLHVDGDSFFVGCELIRRPDLRGKPVVTGEERGIASAMSYEAKRLGVTRAYPIFKLRQDFPQVVVLPGDYELYEEIARRMYKIVRRFTPVVEEYSVDECFALLRSSSFAGQALSDVAREIKDTLCRELGLTFSVGLAPTKVLAKLASKRDKPDGLVCVDQDSFARELHYLPIERVWGIGYRSVPLMRALGVQTVGDFAARSEGWVRERWNVNMLELWRELRGEMVYRVGEGDLSKHQSIQKTRTFGPATSDPKILFAQLAKNIENAFDYARSLGKSPLEASFFIKTSNFRYRVTSVKFLAPLQAPETLLSEVRLALPELVRKGEVYRATGVTLSNFTDFTSGSQDKAPPDLFGNYKFEDKRVGAHNVADELYEKYGSRQIVLASTLSARAPGRSLGALGRTQATRTFLGLPHLGQVW